jgi:carbamoyltransferase
MFILGISAYYHDSAAALVQDGRIIAAAQEERFTRKKHDHEFPKNAVKYCLNEADIKMEQIDYMVFYDKPFIKFERLLETYLSFAPEGWNSFRKAMPLWLSKKLYLPKIIKKELSWDGKILFTEHHESHAASAFFPSPFKEAAVVCFDGVGEWATTTWGIGIGNKVELKQQISFPHSLGLLYSAFTYYLGFKVNSGEYKIMGLAPYGEPIYVNKILELIDIKKDGSFRLNMDYFNYCQGLTMTNGSFDKLFGGPPRKPESKLTQREMDIAASIQKVTEDIMLKMCRHVKKETGMENLCMAGGVALNCVGNGKIYREGLFSNIWVQPAAGDAGGALGAALTVWHHYLGKERDADGREDKMAGSYLGPSFDNEEIKTFLNTNEFPYKELDDESLYNEIADRLGIGEVIGWFSGRMEFGPRSLGARSIIGDARNPEMQKKMNLKVKYRESFRPFAPAVLLEHVSEWFEYEGESPYMLMVAPLKENRKIQMTEGQKTLFGIDKLNIPRSDIPAVTHVDYSARIQTVNKNNNRRFYELIKKFYEKTGCPVIVNTSFNVRGEPIVCMPQDAYRCFMRTEMDVLVLENCIILKSEQPEWKEKGDWKKEFELD